MIKKQNSYTTEKFRVLFCTDIPIPEFIQEKFDNAFIDLCDDLPDSKCNTQYFYFSKQDSEKLYKIEVIFDIERFDKK